MTTVSKDNSTPRYGRNGAAAGFSAAYIKATPETSYFGRQTWTQATGSSLTAKLATSTPGRLAWQHCAPAAAGTVARRLFPVVHEFTNALRHRRASLLPAGPHASRRTDIHDCVLVLRDINVSQRKGPGWLAISPFNRL